MSSAMKALVSSAGSVQVVDRDLPSGDGELLTVTSSGICGSDLHMVAAGLSGVILGHEFGGRLPDGRLAAIRPTGDCGSCPSCLAGHPNTCRRALADLHGTAIEGGIAEFVRVETSRVVPMPAGSDPASVALVEPLAVAVHGVDRAGIQPGMSALIVGAGSIGLLTVAVLVARGVEVDLVARHPHQAAAGEALGARVVTGPRTDYDLAFDAVCSQQSFDSCVSATRPRGTIVEFGLAWGPVSITNTLLLKEISLVPTMFYAHDAHTPHSHGTDDFAAAADLLASTPAIAQALVTHRFAIADSAEAFRVAGDRSSGAIKVHIHP